MRASACKHVLGLPENSCTAKCPAVLFRPWRSDSLCFTHTDPPPALQSRAALQSVLPRVREKKTQKHTSVSISKARTIIQATRTLSAQPRFETQLASCAQCSCVCMLHMYCRQAQRIVCCRVAKQKALYGFVKTTNIVSIIARKGVTTVCVHLQVASQSSCCVRRLHASVQPVDVLRHLVLSQHLEHQSLSHGNSNVHVHSQSFCFAKQAHSCVALLLHSSIHYSLLAWQLSSVTNTGAVS